jgi:hypothetical protein
MRTMMIGRNARAIKRGNQWDYHSSLASPHSGSILLISLARIR